MTGVQTCALPIYDFFTRALRPDARPLADAPWVCPVDGSISQFGPITGERIFQAKGHDYTTQALLAGDALRNTENLVLPHPRMAFRAFVLEPACEVAAEIIDPRTGWTLRHLREHMERSLRYIAICGANMPAKRRLMAAIAKRVSLRSIVCPVAYEQLLSTPGDSFIEPLLAPLHRSSPLFQGLAAQEWVCSDYSVRELISWSTVYLREPDRSQRIARLNLETAALMDAKFTLFLDTPVVPDNPVENRQIDASTSESGEQAIAYAAALRAEMTQKNGGPVLHLTAAEENTVVEEALAAMQASCPTYPER